MASHKNSAHQAAWRDRQRKAGLVQVTLWVSPDAAPDFKTAADISQQHPGAAVRLSVCDPATGRFVTRRPKPALSWDHAGIGADEINPFVWTTE